MAETTLTAPVAEAAEPAPPRFHVDPNAAAGGDGSLDRPFRILDEAIAAKPNAARAVIVLRRGQVHEPPGTIGRDKATRLTLGAYGHDPQRPMIGVGGDGGALKIQGDRIDGLKICDLHLVSSGASREFGLTILNDTGSGVELRRLKIEGFQGGINLRRGHNYLISECEILNNYPQLGGHSQGIYHFGMRGLTIRGCDFDHNGWRTIEQRTIYNHTIYGAGTAEHPLEDLTIEDCNILRGASWGITASSNDAGGVRNVRIRRNLLCGNRNGIMIGGAEGAAEGVEIADNAILGLVSSTPTVAAHGFGLELKGVTGGVAERNAIGLPALRGGTQVAIKAIEHCRDLAIRNNPSIAWPEGRLYIAPELDAGGNGQAAPAPGIDVDRLRTLIAQAADVVGVGTGVRR